jgi:hypothetical protein
VVSGDIVFFSYFGELLEKFIHFSVLLCGILCKYIIAPNESLVNKKHKNIAAHLGGDIKR